jgi:putative selenate reductase molybdopterin-binding subunit
MWMPKRSGPGPIICLESEYRVHQVQQASIEPHIVVTWWDEDDRLTIRTSTQVPFHVRRMIAPLIGLPVRASA